jgi:hypothetical protein
MLEKATEEVAGTKTKSPLEEGGEHHNLFSVGCQDVLPFGRMPLKHRAIWDEMVLD